MKSFFVNSRGHPDFNLNDYQSTIHEHRDKAIKTWSTHNKSYIGHTGFNTKTPPAFFIDKYGFRSWISEASSVIPSMFVSIPETDFTRLFKTYDNVIRTSVIGSKILNTSAPSVEETVYKSKFLDWIFIAWQKHLSGNGIELSSETINWYFSVPLLEVYRNSVFYPRYPVLWGPNYFGKIDTCDQEYILNHYGKNAVWDFYFFMMVCHEQSHLMQKGEPILNEIAHAILWIDFITKQGLESFQVNSKTGRTCNIEAPFILDRINDFKGLDYGLLFEDNQKFFEEDINDSQYAHFVALSFLVHAGVLRYRYMTNLFCGLLTNNASVSNYLKRDLVGHLDAIFNAVVNGVKKSELRHLVKSRLLTFGVTSP